MLTDPPRSFRLLVIAGVLICLASRSALAAPTNDLSKQELTGPVKTAVTRHPQLRTIHHFDRDGHLTKVELFPSQETGPAQYRLSYDDAGRVTEEQTIEPDGHVLYRKVYRYGFDEQGRQVAMIAATDEGQLAYAEFNLYDERGVLTEDLAITGNGTVEKALYDIGGKLVYLARYFQGRLVMESTHHHGPLGRLRESRFYSGDGTLMRKDVYRYNDAGQRIEQVSEFFRSAHLRKSVVIYEFDTAGNWTKETIQRWAEKNGVLALMETVVSRERQITYY
jgi:YD repeat-containing protein